MNNLLNVLQEGHEFFLDWSKCRAAHLGSEVPHCTYTHAYSDYCGHFVYCLED